MEEFMAGISRRGLLGALAGLGGAAAAPAAITTSASAGHAPAGKELGEPAFSWARVELLKRGLIGEIGEDAYQSWFAAAEVERYVGGVLFVSVPVAFLKKWIEAHYIENLIRAAQRIDGNISEVRIAVRGRANESGNISAR